jgi:two-component system NtrC family sensor kinase
MDNWIILLQTLGTIVLSSILMYLVVQTRKRMEAALRESEKRLEQSMVEKKVMRSDKLASIGRLSANLVHKLANPLDGVRRYVKMLYDHMSDDDPGKVYAEEALDGLKRIEQDIVAGLSDLAKKSRQVFRPTNIAQSIEEILDLFKNKVSTQNIKVEVQFSEDIPPVFNADIVYIFENIMNNSIQAMPKGGTMSIMAGMIGPDMIEVMISDTGSGIPEEMQREIFEPFYTTKEIGEGVGLGLAISQGIAESYNGSISVESKVGEGSTFIIRLPIGDSGLSVREESV